MILKYLKKFYIFFIFFNLMIGISYSEIIKSFKITGNERISNDTIIMFSNVSVGSDINSNDLNIILKNIYESKFIFTRDKDIVSTCGCGESFYIIP